MNHERGKSCEGERDGFLFEKTEGKDVKAI